jgi:hypothetical protein
MNKKNSTVLILSLLFAAANSEAAPVWDLSADFSIAANPNGQWSYGSMPYAGGIPNAASLALYTVGDPDIPLTVGAGASTIEGRYTVPVDPNLTHNKGAATYSNFGITWSPGEVSLGPGFNTTDVAAATAARWTAPTTGLYNVFAQFQDNQANANGADVYVCVGGVPVYTANSGATPEAGPPAYTSLAPLALTAGQTVDFIVGATGGASGNNTELAATITQVPEPAGWILLVIGGLIGFVHRRKIGN